MDWTPAAGLVIAGLNNDGRLDLSIGAANGLIAVALGTGDGSFQPFTSFTLTGEGVTPGLILASAFARRTSLYESGTDYAVNADGSRFLANTALDEVGSSAITVITNWAQVSRNEGPLRIGSQAKLDWIRMLRRFQAYLRHLRSKLSNQSSTMPISRAVFRGAFSPVSVPLCQDQFKTGGPPSP